MRFERGWIIPLGLGFGIQAPEPNSRFFPLPNGLRQAGYVLGSCGTRSRIVRGRRVLWLGGDGCRAVGGDRKVPSGRKPTGGLVPPCDPLPNGQDVVGAFSDGALGERQRSSALRNAFGGNQE